MRAFDALICQSRCTLLNIPRKLVWNRVQVRLFDVLLKSITFSMISVEAGNAILRKLARQVSISFDAMLSRGEEADVLQALQGTSRHGQLSVSASLEILRAGKHELVRT